MAAFAMLLGTCGIAQADGSLQGRWRGQLDCNSDRDIRMELELSSVTDGRLTGTLEFGAGSRKGVLNMAGTAAADGTFELSPGTWVRQPRGFQATGMRGESFRMGQKDGIRGSLPPLCQTGGFTAFRQAPIVKPPPAPKLPLRERDPKILTDTVRRNVEMLMERRELRDDPWNLIRLGIEGSRVDKQLREQLLAEVDAARNKVIAEVYQGKLEADPQSFPEGVNEAIRELRRAQKAGLEGPGLQELHAAAKARVNAIMAVEFKRAAALLPGLTETLDSLIAARAAIAPLEEYRRVIEDLFGVFDPDWILKPLLRRIAELEASPVVGAALRDALAEARQGPDPRGATRALLLSVLGPDGTGSPLAPIAVEGRGLAAIAAIEVIDAASGSTDSLEPSARDIALFSFERWRVVDEITSKLRCAPGPIDAFPTDITKCALGAAEVWVSSVTKFGCQAEIPGKQYVCEFRESVQMTHRNYVTSAAKSAVWDLLFSLLPNGFPGDLTSARFVRDESGKGWTVHWGRLTSYIPPVFVVPTMPQTESPADVIRLHKEKRSALHRRNLSGLCIADETQASTATCKKVFDLIASKSFEVLSCSYGPFGQDGGGFETYTFWSNRAPEGIESYRVDETDHPFELLGDQAILECPSDTRALELIYRDTRF